ncbi:MAG: hypothetical protein IIC33_00385 [Chloroflexi bacterium]|nr:hypothetical protein [Chloroflexota bacterium]
MVFSEGKIPQRVGEVIAANSDSFVAQCYQLYGAPAIGHFVRAGSPPIYGVVHQVRTEPLDPARPVLARGQDAETEEDVYRDNPQIARLLTSRFESLIVGYQREEVYYQHLPPLPPKVHSFVYSCSPDEVAVFTDNLDFLHLLVRSRVAASDEVIGACVQAASASCADGQDFMMRAGRVLATELSADLPRINAILRRLTS